MGNNRLPFEQNTCDLGYDKYTGMSKEDVDSMLKSSDLGTSHTCLICGRPATFRLIPQKGVMVSALIQDKGFVCANCVTGHLVPQGYGVKGF